jgi:hypothetical protein
MTVCNISTSAIVVLAGIALGLAAPARAEPQVPRLDLTPTCRPMAKNDALQLDESRCRQSENAAREQLVREWSNFPAADRTECTTAATMGGTASYVELITCLEMKRHVANMSKQTDEPSPSGKSRRKR